jgi:hypothetical protein
MATWLLVGPRTSRNITVDDYIANWLEEAARNPLRASAAAGNLRTLFSLDLSPSERNRLDAALATLEA